MLPLSQLDASPKTAGILVLAVETSYLTQLDIGDTCLKFHRTYDRFPRGGMKLALNADQSAGILDSAICGRRKQRPDFPNTARTCLRRRIPYS